MSIEPQIEATTIELLDPDTRDCRMLAGWVSPEGKYFKVPGIWGHETLATQISGCAEVGGRALELDGWVHLLNDGSPATVRGLAYTQAQLDTLFDLGLKLQGQDFGKKILAAIAPAHSK